MTPSFFHSRVRRFRPFTNLSEGTPAVIPAFEAVAARFWPKVAIGASNECWPWQASKRPAGYGRFWLDGRIRNSHVVAHLLATGIEPGELYVCHACDNPPCCNPAHLWLGTPSDNMMDAIAKGRRHPPDKPSRRPPPGSPNGMRKFTGDQAIEIVRRLRDGASNSAIGREYGVPNGTISNMRLGKTYSFFTGIKYERGGAR